MHRSPHALRPTETDRAKRWNNPNPRGVNPMKLKNKVAFVTGGTSGIGLETAKLFQAECAKLVLVGSNDDRLRAAGGELNGVAVVVRADIRKVADIARAVDATRKQFGHVDIVFANAG